MARSISRSLGQIGDLDGLGVSDRWAWAGQSTIRVSSTLIAPAGWPILVDFAPGCSGGGGLVLWGQNVGDRLEAPESEEAMGKRVGPEV